LKGFAMGSHIVIVDGGQKETVYAGQSVLLCSWSVNEKTLQEGLCYFTVSTSTPEFALSAGAETTGYQDASATITWSCKQKGASTVTVDLRPNFTFCLAADTMSINVHLAPLQPLPLWPGVNKLDAMVCGTYGHGFRTNKLFRTALGGRVNPGVIQLDRPNFASHVFARVSPNHATASELNVYGGSIGGFASPTFTEYVAGGATSAPRYTGELPLSSQDTNAVLSLGDPPNQTGVLGYVVRF
jgi:hypothetical protein